MVRPQLTALALLILLPLGLDALAPGVDPLDPERDLATLVPDRCFGYLESRTLDALLEEGLEHPLVVQVLGSEFGQALLSQADNSPEELLAFADAMAGTSVLGALADLTAGGVALGVAPGAEGKVVLILRGADELDTEELLHKAFDLVEAQIGMPGLLDDPQRTIRGAEFWQVGEAMVARREATLVLGNDEGLLRDVLDLAADAETRGLLGNDEFAATHGARDEGALLFGWLDLEAIESSNPGQLKDLREAAVDPGVHALLGPSITTLSSAHRIAAQLSLEGDGLSLRLHGTDAASAQALLPGGRSDEFGPLPAFASEEDVANALFYRDYAGMFENRVAIFPPDRLPGFAKAISDMGLFFGGRDIGEDVLPHVSPWIRVVSRPVEFADKRRPEIPLPALALIAEVDDGEATGADMVTAFQTLISILNVEEAQKGGRMMRLSLGLEGDVQITSASFPPPGPEDGVDLSYNLQPACALVGKRLILGTHEHLVRALARQATEAATESSSGTRESLMLDGPSLARVIEQNFESLVMSKVLDDGVDRAEAEDEIGGLRLLAAGLERVALQAEHPAADEVVLSLQVELVGGSAR